MNLADNKSSKDVIDLQLKDFVEVVSTNQRFQNLAYNLTDICWETCMDKLTPRLESKTKECVTNCVERFIDTTNFITNRLSRVTTSSKNNWD
ncbi:mitochondrial import inner membrane translocase subunit Tim8 A-like isoform X1 [Venturia canescens]|uniref:mitochondrial import inner membrane translocase subunit Tim8 A-like isoform X1 n=1 Tax=Venturia canescens TaxID=32260 RepID=UPI001C9D29C7|nr:mitochondrial import inner membrane translocase subunit Tim8 A-like isoform X1 [Venturia canescens]